jgi:hypothetical protein
MGIMCDQPTPSSSDDESVASVASVGAPSVASGAPIKLLDIDDADDRYTVDPILNHDIWDIYQREAVPATWFVPEIPIAGDLKDWEDPKKVSPPLRHFIEMVLAFFAGADKLVADNINTNFIQDVKVLEAEHFYGEDSRRSVLQTVDYVRQRPRETETPHEFSQDDTRYKEKGRVGGKIYEWWNICRTSYCVYYIRGGVLLRVILCHLLHQDKGDIGRIDPIQ